MKKRIISFMTALSMTLMLFTSMPISGFTASAVAKDPVEITLYDSSTAPAGEDCGSGGKTYSVSSSQLSSWGVDADGLSSCYVIVTYAEAPTGGVIGINANNANGEIDWTANFSYTESISGTTTSTVALSSVGNKATTVIANGLTVQVKSAYVSKIDFNTGSSSENIFTYTAGAVSEIEFNAAAMAALEGASGISAQITGTGSGYGYFTEMSSWNSTEGGNPATLTNENEKWDTFVAASGIKIVFGGFDSISKVVLTITYPTNAGDGIEINEANFPDNTFRQYVSDNCDTDKNGSLSDVEIKQVNYINVINKSISNMKGIEYFTALTTLSCQYNQLIALDVSNNSALNILFCSNNQLTSLDLSKNTALENLDCSNNQLTSLDLSKNTALTRLYCHNNKLTSLDISKNTDLTAENVTCRSNCYTVTGCMISSAALPGSFDLSKASNWTNAKIENGKIISDGTDTATYEYDCGNGKSETFSIQFGQHNYVNGTCTRCGSTYAAPTMTISPKTLTVPIGETAVITETVTNGDDCMYNETTSDADIAAITASSALENGVRTVTVEGRSAGTAVITLKIIKSDVEVIVETCNVTVTDGTTPTYTLTPAAATVKTGLSNGQVFTLEGYTAIEQIYWDIDPAYAAVYTGSGNSLENNQCKIVGTAVGGPVTLTAKSLDGDVLGTATITFTDDDIPSHTHTLTAHAAVDATCTAAGNSAYWTCSGCNKIFSDGNGTAEISAIPTIPALGHNYVDGVCTRCGDIQSQTHTHTGGTATCTAKAVCTVCGQEYGELLPHSENGGAVTIQPTETTAGEMTYRCTVCGTVTRTVSIPPTGEVHTHVFGTEWKYSDTRHWHECACGERADEALHTPDSGTVTKQPTAYETGVRTYYCTVCGGFIFSEIIPPTGTTPSPVIPYFPPSGTTISSAPVNKEPYMQDDSGKKGWEVISDNIWNAVDGETVKVNMNGTTELPKNIVSNIAGRNIDLVLDMGGYSWTINGMSVTNAKSVDMSVRKIDKIPESTVREFFGDLKTVQLDLRHNGDFGFIAELTIDIGNRYSGMFANSYCYRSKSFEFGDSSEIVNGKARLRFAHASRWLIVIDSSPVLEDVSTGSAAHSAGTPIDMSNSTSGVTLPEFDEKKKLRLSNSKRRYRILKKRKLDDMVFVL